MRAGKDSVSRFAKTSLTTSSRVVEGSCLFRALGRDRLFVQQQGGSSYPAGFPKIVVDRCEIFVIADDSPVGGVRSFVFLFNSPAANCGLNLMCGNEKLMIRMTRISYRFNKVEGWPLYPPDPSKHKLVVSSPVRNAYRITNVRVNLRHFFR